MLEAIARLERRIDTMAGPAGASAELEKVREAIASARSDIAKMQGNATLSAEGRIFAELADLAKSTFAAKDSATGSGFLPDGVVRTLRLVEQLDQSLSSPKPSGDTYFKRDQDLFEPPPKPAKPLAIVEAAPVAAPARAAEAVKSSTATVQPEVEAPALGAQLVINRVRREEAPQPQSPLAPMADAAAVPPVETAVTDSAQELTVQDHPRIVIIRRKPEDMPELPVDGQPVTDQVQSGHAA
jgi:hypothetical protein